jgi:CheY-like chemotaxis protein
VLLNLAVNARDAMPNGGTLTVVTANQTVTSADDAVAGPAPPTGKYARIRIADTGVGIPPDVLERVFEPFFTTKAPGEGTGLGLATVYGILSQAGGFANIQSVPGAGTAFVALLPATEDIPVVADKVPAAPQQDCHGVETILVVEDEEALREVTKRILTRNGYQVMAAGTGPEAIKIVEDFPQRVDLLLTDVIMPHLHGQEVAEQICAMRPGLRVIFMSGYAQPFITGGGTLDRDAVLITKPFTQAELLTRLREVLRSTEPRPAPVMKSPR